LRIQQSNLEGAKWIHLISQHGHTHEKFLKDFLEKADIDIQERRKIISTMSSLFSFYFNSKRGIHVLDLGCGDRVTKHEAKVLERMAA